MENPIKNKIINHIQNKINPEDLHRVLSSFDMAETAYINQIIPYQFQDFDHNLRMFWILVDELCIYEPDMMISCLLYGIKNFDPSISYEIISYNFGDYVAFLVEDSGDILTKYQKDNKLLYNNDDYIILRLIHYLDKLRNQQFNPINELIALLAEIKQKFANAIEKNQNPIITELIAKINIESNKFFT